MPTKTKPTGGRGKLRRPRTQVNKQEEVTAATLIALAGAARDCSIFADENPRLAWMKFRSALLIEAQRIRGKHGGGSRVMFTTAALKRELAKDVKTATRRLTKAGVRFRG